MFERKLLLLYQVFFWLATWFNVRKCIGLLKKDGKNLAVSLSREKDQIREWKNIFYSTAIFGRGEGHSLQHSA